MVQAIGLLCCQKLSGNASETEFNVMKQNPSSGAVDRTRSSSEKNLPERGRSAKKPDTSPDHRERFEQLLDDAVAAKNRRN